MLHQKILNGFLLHLSVLGRIRLIADEGHADGGIGVLLDLLQPVGQVFEGLGSGQVEHYHCAYCIPVVAGGNCSEAFLTGSVPNLVSDSLAVDVQHLSGKLDPDGGFGVVLEGVVEVFGEQVGLAYS